MKPIESPSRGTAAPWSQETETRPEMQELLALRRPLSQPEVKILRRLYGDVYDAHYDDVWKTLIKWRVRGKAHLEELTQETFARLWDTTVTSGPPDAILAKLRGLAMGVALNLGKRKKRSPETDRSPPSSSSEKPAMSGPRVDHAIDVKEVALKLFHVLSPVHQRVVSAVVLRDLTYEEAGLELGLAASTVGSLLKAALKRLRKLAPELLSPSQQAVR
jgi:RNA polymerase sigma factor (sigma-70 family)